MRAILMLHGVDDEGSVLSLRAEELEGLLRAIRAANHALVPLSRLLSEPSAPDLEAAVALSFDDGFASVSLAAAPLLRRVGAPATLFLTTGHVGADNRWPSQPASAPTRRMLSWEQVAELAADGWEIGAHSESHPDLRQLEDAALEAELVRPRQEIERRIGRRPALFAYPYGSLDERVVAAVARHYRYAVTTHMAALPRTLGDPYRVPRIDAWYLRSPRVHRHFGSRRFRRYLAARSLLRRARARALS